MLNVVYKMVINNSLQKYWQYQYQYFVLKVLVMPISILISKILKFFFIYVLK